jgi:hypothetical protein
MFLIMTELRSSGKKSIFLFLYLFPGARLSGPCRQGQGSDPQGRRRGKEEEEDRPRQEEDPVQQALRQRRADLWTQEGTQR